MSLNIHRLRLNVLLFPSVVIFLSVYSGYIPSCYFLLLLFSVPCVVSWTVDNICLYV